MSARQSKRARFAARMRQRRALCRACAAAATRRGSEPLTFKRFLDAYRDPDPPFPALAQKRLRPIPQPRAVHLSTPRFGGRLLKSLVQSDEKSSQGAYKLFGINDETGELQQLDWETGLPLPIPPR